MFPKYHLIVGLLVSLILFLVFPGINLLAAVIIFLSSVLIDFDHYLYYAIKKRDLSLNRAYKWFVRNRIKLFQLAPKERENFKDLILIFHGIECWILLILFSFVSKIFIWIMIGIVIHMILDFFDMFAIEEPFYSKMSQIFVIFNNKNKKEFDLS